MQRVLVAIVLALASGACGSEREPGPSQFGEIDPGACTERRFVQLDCYSGPAGTEGVGVCRKATSARCLGGAWVCSAEVLPSLEVCNRQDDDCDGQVDEEPTVEVCNYRDDDCDGEVDEGLADEAGLCDEVLCGAEQLDGDCLTPPPSHCEGNQLVSSADGVCVDGLCRWTESRDVCSCGCWEGECWWHCP